MNSKLLCVPINNIAPISVQYIFNHLTCAKKTHNINFAIHSLVNFKGFEDSYTIIYLHTHTHTH